MTNKEGPTYKGVLSEPFGPLMDLIEQAIDNAEPGGAKPAIAKAIDSRQRQEAAKEEALLRHYRIDPSANNAYRRLALAVARDHVPGFQEATPRPIPGAPRKWGPWDKVRLVLEMQALLAHGSTLDQAAKKLARKHPWKNKGPKEEGLTWRTLKRRYTETSRELTGLDIFATLARPDGLGGSKALGDQINRSVKALNPRSNN